MPLYDCVLLLKPHVTREALMDLVARVGKHACRRNGVITDLKSFGTVNLGYGIKKLDGRHYQGQLLQMTMMTPPSFHGELHYLNKEDRLLRWLLIKHRDLKVGSRIWGEDFLMRGETSSRDDATWADFRDFTVEVNDPLEFHGFFSRGIPDKDEDADEDEFKDQDDEEDDDDDDDDEPDNAKGR